MSNPSPDPELDRLHALARRLEQEAEDLRVAAASTQVGSPERAAAAAKAKESDLAWAAIPGHLRPDARPADDGQGPASA